MNGSPPSNPGTEAGLGEEQVPEHHLERHVVSSVEIGHMIGDAQASDAERALDQIRSASAAQRSSERAALPALALGVGAPHTVQATAPALPWLRRLDRSLVGRPSFCPYVRSDAGVEPER